MKEMSEQNEREARLVERVSKASPRSEMLHRIGPLLAGLLCHERDHLHLMNEGDLLQRWFSSDDHALSAETLLLQIVHKHPHIRILEIGSLVNGCAKSVISEDIRPPRSPYHYDFTNAWDSEGSYDVVVVSGYPQPSTDHLKSIRALLKQGGRLLLAHAHLYSLDRELVLRLLERNSAHQPWDAIT